MNDSVIIFKHLLSLLASWTFYNEQNTSGHSPDAAKNSQSHHEDTPFVMASIVTTAHDNWNEMATALRSHAPRGSRYYRTGEKSVLEAIGLGNRISEKDIDVLMSSWDSLKKRISDLAPNVFLRYIHVRPDARKMFPLVADVTDAELRYNSQFLSTAYNCISSLNYIIPHLRYSFGGGGSCPVLANLRNDSTGIDLQVLGNIWLTTIQEEMGDRDFTDAIRDSWKKVFLALDKYTYE